MQESMEYFDKNTEFEIDDFIENVVKKPDLIEPFKEHRQIYELNQGLEVKERFNISESAVKSAKRKIKSLIKLNTEIEIKLKKVSDENVECWYRLY